MVQETLWQDLGLAIPELVPVPSAECRLNLVLPAIFNEWSYGGIPTALRFFDKLIEGFDCARLILQYQAKDQSDIGEEWSQWSTDQQNPTARSIVFGAGNATPLTIGPYDLFIASCWTTAVYVRQVVTRQTELFRLVNRRYIYFIQDYEPGFYPWSTEYVCAASTYRDTEHTIAVFNSRPLATYFFDQGLHFPEEYIFEPMLHPRLKATRLIGARRSQKEKLILIYGRPSQSRNAFALAVEAVRIWANAFPHSREWTAISAGEQHRDIALSEKVTLLSKGKLSLDEYGTYLSRCWTGLSLMVSPHPSYPPLEMAEFGCWTITNTFANKDLSKRAANIISVSEMSPGAIAERLCWCCSQYESGRSAVLNDLPSPFQATEEEFPFWRGLVNTWRPV